MVRLLRASEAPIERGDHLRRDDPIPLLVEVRLRVPHDLVDRRESGEDRMKIEEGNARRADGVEYAASERVLLRTGPAEEIR